MQVTEGIAQQDRAEQEEAEEYGDTVMGRNEKMRYVAERMD